MTYVNFESAEPSKKKPKETPIEKTPVKAVDSIQDDITSLQTALKYATPKNKKAIQADIDALEISLKYK